MDERTFNWNLLIKHFFIIHFCAKHVYNLIFGVGLPASSSNASNKPQWMASALCSSRFTPGDKSPIAKLIVEKARFVGRCHGCLFRKNKKLMMNVHIEQGQCVLSSHLFWWQLWLNDKVLQGYIVSPHFLLMCWPPSFRFTQLLVLECHRPSILH